LSVSKEKLVGLGPVEPEAGAKTGHTRLVMHKVEFLLDRLKLSGFQFFQGDTGVGPTPFSIAEVEFFEFQLPMVDGFVIRESPFAGSIRCVPF
jgi:hypothetical protein